MGGGITYIKRYAVSALLGIATDTDDDAESSSLEVKIKDFKPAKTTKAPAKTTKAPVKTAQGIKTASEAQIGAIRATSNKIKQYLNRITEEQAKHFGEWLEQLNIHKQKGTLTPTIASGFIGKLTNLADSINTQDNE